MLLELDIDYIDSSQLPDAGSKSVTPQTPITHLPSQIASSQRLSDILAHDITRRDGALEDPQFDTQWSVEPTRDK